ETWVMVRTSSGMLPSPSTGRRVVEPYVSQPSQRYGDKAEIENYGIEIDRIGGVGEGMPRCFEQRPSLGAGQGLGQRHGPTHAFDCFPCVRPDRERRLIDDH